MVKRFMLTCGLLFGTFTSQAQFTYLDSAKPALPAGPSVDNTTLKAAAQAKSEAYRRSHPCPYAKAGQDPSCVEGHKDSIIPVQYGLPSGKEMKQRVERGELKLGGCLVSDCDPYYYCTRHKKYL